MAWAGNCLSRRGSRNIRSAEIAPLTPEVPLGIERRTCVQEHCNPGSFSPRNPEAASSFWFVPVVR